MGLCAVSRFCEGGRNKGKAQLSSALDRISGRITLEFQTPFPPRSNLGINHRKHKFTLCFNRTWRRECQLILIERQSIFDLLRPKPTIRATSVKWDFAPDHNLFRQWPVIDEMPSSDSHVRIVSGAPFSAVTTELRQCAFCLARVLGPPPAVAPAAITTAAAHQAERCLLRFATAPDIRRRESRRPKCRSRD